MKFAVSIPDTLFRAAEREAKRRGVTRSRIVQDALQQLLSKQRGEAITAAINDSIAKYGDPSEEFAPFHDAALREMLSNSEWDE